MGMLMASTLAMSTATTAASYIGQSQAASANKVAAINAMGINSRQTNMGMMQEDAAASLRAQQSQSQQLQAASTAAASAGENGVSGNSVDALINNYKSAEGNYFNSLATQGQWDRSQGQAQKVGQTVQAEDQINRVPAPTFLGAALRIGGDAFGAYNSTYGQASIRNARSGY